VWTVNIIVSNQAKLGNQAEQQHEQQRECNLVDLMVGNLVGLVKFEYEFVVDSVPSKYLNTESGA